MTAENPLTAGNLCTWIARRIEATTPKGTDTTVYAYGGHPDDPTVCGADHVTTVLAEHPAGQRWFRVTVSEFDPDQLPAWKVDHDVLAALHYRALGTIRPFPGPRIEKHSPALHLVPSVGVDHGELRRTRRVVVTG